MDKTLWLTFLGQPVYIYSVCAKLFVNKKA